MKYPVSFKNSKKDNKLLEKIMSFDSGERSFEIKKALYKAFFGEEY